MKLKPALLLAIVLCFAAFAHADITYDYTGNVMNCVGSCPVSNLTLHGSMTLAAPLAGGLFFGPVTPTSYDFFVTGTNFTSQHFTQDPPAPDAFAFITDPSGVITGWQISFTGSLETSSTVKFGSGGDSFHDSTGIAFSASNSSPGVWTVAGATPVPEPSSLALFGSGIAALAATVRRRK